MASTIQKLVIDTFHNTMTFYHSIQVNKVEITDSATFWLGPSKEDSSVVVDTRQCEICTGRRSSPSDRRGEPDTYRRVYTDQYITRMHNVTIM